MNILIVTGHPAQVHNFKLLKQILERRGHKVFWMATNKDISKYLLDYYSIKYKVLKKPGKGKFSKFVNLIVSSAKIYSFIKSKKIDIIVSRVSPYASLGAFFRRTNHIALADTESSGVYDTIFTKFVTTFMSAKSFKRTLRNDQIRFDGNIELFYLHPNRFMSKTRKEVANILCIQKDQPYIIMRFVSWDAYHDKGLSGFTDANKIRVVKEYSKYAKVFISSEKELPKEIEPYKIQIAPELMHDVLAHASLFFGESATMASESAVLGRPGIFLDKYGRGYTDEEEMYNLLFNFKQSLIEQDRAIEKGIELLKNPALYINMQKNHTAFLKNKIDVTAFMIWFIENYPESKNIMKTDSDYQYKFK